VPDTVVNAALTAASLDLPISPSLGFAAIVPYKSRGKYHAQFQIQWKGYIQLAQRSGKCKTISATAVYEGQLKDTDPLRGITWDWTVKPKGDPIGYASYFELLNGFEKTLYMTRKQVDDHGRRYSQSYKYDLKDKKKESLWSKDFDAMALKTVIKQLISKFGPMSTVMEKALENDQAVITETGRVYIDNDLEEEKATEEEKRAIVEANIPTIVETNGRPVHEAVKEDADVKAAKERWDSTHKAEDE